ncbi:hypothetical protein DMA11_24120 [Marinilabiliaceae bacterium JC017]|nr:hypothetical protein DMA11_24120 [Marinilabiliaceae bacterium JC017]
MPKPGKPTPINVQPSHYHIKKAWLNPGFFVITLLLFFSVVNHTMQSCGSGAIVRQRGGAVATVLIFIRAVAGG